MILPIASRIFYQTHFFPLLKLHGKIEEIYFSLRAKEGHDIPMLINASRRCEGEEFVYDCIFIPILQRIKYEDEILKAKKAAEEEEEKKRLQEKLNEDKIVKVSKKSKITITLEFFLKYLQFQKKSEVLCLTLSMSVSDNSLYFFVRKSAFLLTIPISSFFIII
jgi:hypothetical protein